MRYLFYGGPSRSTASFDGFSSFLSPRVSLTTTVRPSMRTFRLPLMQLYRCRFFLFFFHHFSIVNLVNGYAPIRDVSFGVRPVHAQAHTRSVLRVKYTNVVRHSRKGSAVRLKRICTRSFSHVVFIGTRIDMRFRRRKAELPSSRIIRRPEQRRNVRFLPWITYGARRHNIYEYRLNILRVSQLHAAHCATTLFSVGSFVFAIFQ